MWLKFKIASFFLLILQGSIAQEIEVLPIFQTGHHSKVNHIQFHSDNQHLVSCGDDGKLVIWDIQLGLQRNSILAHTSGIRIFDFLNDSTLVSLNNQSELQFWNFPTLKLTKTIAFPDQYLQDFTILDETSVALSGLSVMIHNWKENQTRILKTQSNFKYSSIAYNPVKNEIAFAGPYDNFCGVISLEESLKYDNIILGNITELDYLDSNNLLVINDNGSITSFNELQKEKVSFLLKDSKNYVHSLAWTNNFIVAATNFGFAKVLNRTNFQEEYTIGLNGKALTASAFSKDQKWLALANTSGSIQLYETEGFKLNQVLKGVSANIVDVKIVNDAMFVAYSDGLIRRVILPENKILSNSIKPDVYEQKSGLNYSFLSIDKVENNRVECTVLKSDRHHKKSSLLISAQTVKAIWNLKTNQLTLGKRIKDRNLEKQVKSNFHNEIPFKIEDYLARPHSFENNGSYFKVSEEGFSFAKNSEVDFPVKHTSPILGLRFLEKDSLILSYSMDGSIRFWSRKGDYLSALYLSGQYGFTYINEENQYFASKDMLNKVGFLHQDKLFSFEQFDLLYNRPAEVIKDLSYFSVEDVDAYHLAYLKRLEKLKIEQSELTVARNLPEIQVKYDSDYQPSQKTIEVELTFFDAESPIQSYSYSINGIENLVKLSNSDKTVSRNIEIELSAGVNQIEFYCTNADGVKSLVKKNNINCETEFETPNLYLVTIGLSEYSDSSQNLVYADKDAAEVERLFQKTKKFNKINQLSYLNEAFTKNQINEIFEHLSKATINDVILFYYAGHGVLDSKLDYYLSTYNMDFNNPTEKGVLFDEIESGFEKLTCRNKLILVDACFSGEIDKDAVTLDSTIYTPSEQGDIEFRSSNKVILEDGRELGILELAKMTFVDLNSNRGTNILSSASGMEYALESKQWENGLFTHVLKEGLSKKEADLNGDKLIQVNELQIYLREKVSLLSSGKQNPILRKENNKNNFVVW